MCKVNILHFFRNTCTCQSFILAYKPILILLFKIFEYLYAMFFLEKDEEWNWLRNAVYLILIPLLDNIF